MIIQHYLKIALRNLLKYKMQSAISIIGLGIGFTCFTFAVLWIRYELTYDDFHEGAERTYLVRAHSGIATYGISNRTPYPLADYLKKNLPEVEAASNTQPSRNVSLRLESGSQTVLILDADSIFTHMFHIQILKGNANFLKEGSPEVAITEQLGKEVFGQEDPIGKELDLNNRKMKICAVVTGWSKHSNFPYGVLTSSRPYREWRGSTVETFIRLKKGTDLEAFEKKITAINLADFNKDSVQENLLITPLTSLHHADYHSRGEIAMAINYIVYFCIAGGLVIVCSLFNYLTLFISRIRMRGRELALRKVNGASDGSLFIQFSIEFLIILVMALLIGMLFIELFSAQFLAFAELSMTTYDLYAEGFLYLLAMIVLSFTAALIPIHYFRKRTLHESISGIASGKRQKNWFRKSGLILQLVISILFIFCTVVIMKQLHYLKYTEQGIERRNIGSVALWMNGDINDWVDKIAALPLITETLPPHYFPLIPTGPMMYLEISTWDGHRTAGDETVGLGLVLAKEDFLKFYGFQLLEGEWINEKSTAQEIVINEAAVKAFGWKTAVGQKFYLPMDGSEDPFTVIGVVKDFHIQPPTVMPKPMGFVLTDKQKELWFRASILFKFKEGTWNECRNAIETLLKEAAQSPGLRLFSEEEEYNKYLRSETALMKLLGCVSMVCLLVSVFGIFSLVTLSCEQRRKEIAIRKVNGARMKDILTIFFKEYLALILLSAAIAFPVGYFMMKSWIEYYVKQTSINAWIYLLIIAGVALVVATCIGWRVWRAAHTNPIKSLKIE